MNLESQRLQYEKITPAHAEELQVALCDHRVYEFITDHGTPTADELLQVFTRKALGSPPTRSDETWIDYAIRSKESGVAIGRIEATILEGQAEVAYLLGPRYWGYGFALEAMCWLHQLLQYEFRVFEFWATVSPNNDRSTRLLARLEYGEATSVLWPIQLLTYNNGDRVFYKPVGTLPRSLTRRSTRTSRLRGLRPPQRAAG
jgi:RimJ/RimL family protein N-acetyltransferase